MRIVDPTIEYRSPAMPIEELGVRLLELRSESPGNILGDASEHLLHTILTLTVERGIRDGTLTIRNSAADVLQDPQ